jgi:hypothetical protein
MRFLEQKIPRMKIGDIKITGCCSFEYKILEGKICFVLKLCYMDDELEDMFFGLTKYNLKPTIYMERIVVDVPSNEVVSINNRYDVESVSYHFSLNEGGDVAMYDVIIYV